MQKDVHADPRQLREFRIDLRPSVHVANFGHDGRTDVQRSQARFSEPQAGECRTSVARRCLQEDHEIENDRRHADDQDNVDQRADVARDLSNGRPDGPGWRDRAALLTCYSGLILNDDPAHENGKLARTVQTVRREKRSNTRTQRAAARRMARFLQMAISLLHRPQVAVAIVFVSVLRKKQRAFDQIHPLRFRVPLVT